MTTTADTTATLDNLTDEQLVALQNAGHADAANVLVTRYVSKLRKFFRNRVSDRHQAEDLVQTALLRAFASSDSFHGGSYSGWVFNIARNLLTDTYRRRKNDTVYQASSGTTADGDDLMTAVSSTVETPAAIAEFRELRSAVELAIADLPDEQRFVFTAYHTRPVDLLTLSQEAGVSESTCKSRMRCARARLSDALAAAGFEPNAA